MQLLEPEKYPHLYKCMYGLLMLLPQSSAFAALKNRLNSVSAIGYLHIAPQRGGPSGYVQPTPSTLNHLRQKSSDVGSGVNSSGSNIGTPSGGPSIPTFERAGRLKPREGLGGGDGAGAGKVQWSELLERFKATQEKARRSQRMASLGEEEDVQEREKTPPAVAAKPQHLGGLRPGSPAGAMRPPPPQTSQSTPGVLGHKPRSSLSNLGRFAGGVAGRRKDKK
jgi:vacuole morphology and inheritance protein 14